MKNFLPAGLSAGQLHAFKQRITSIRQANIQIGRALKLAQHKTESASNILNKNRRASKIIVEP